MTRTCEPLQREQSVKAPIPRAVRGEEQEDEAEQHGGLSVVLDWPVAAGLVELKVGDRHLPGENEGDGLREEPEQDRSAAVELEHPPDPHLRPDRRVPAVLGRDAPEPIEELHPSGLRNSRPETTRRRHSVTCLARSMV